MKHYIIRNSSVPCSCLHYALYGIWHQYNADILFCLHSDWNYFS